RPGWLLMQPPLATLFEFEVFHRVGHVRLRARDARILQRAIQNPPRRSDERTPLQVLIIARLFAYEHYASGTRTFAQNSLGRPREKVAAPAAIDGLTHARNRMHLWNERNRGGERSNCHARFPATGS